MSRHRAKRAPAADPALVAANPLLGYRPSLDGLRAIAVLGVMSWHYVVPGLPGGFLGVDLFFVLSGFLITKLIAEEWDRTGRIHLGRFYLRRVLRLFPALFVLLIASAAFVPREWTIQTMLYITNWGLLSGKLGPSAIMQLWSLSVEEQFYLLWPPVLLLLLTLRTPKRAIYALLLVLAAAAATFKIVAWHTIDDWSRFYFGSDARADELLLGAGLGLFFTWSRVPRRAWFRTTMQVLALPAIALLVTLFLTSAVYWKWFYRDGGITLVALAVVVLLAQLMLAPFGWLRAALGARPMVWIGRRSYGLYLWHSPVAWVTDGRHFDWVPEMSRPVQLVVRVVLTFVVAALSYRFVEQPMLRLKDRFTSSARDATNAEQ